MLRLVVGNPLIMKEMVKVVPDVASTSHMTARWDPKCWQNLIQKGSLHVDWTG
jgi:hypothetical protein